MLSAELYKRINKKDKRLAYNLLSPCQILALAISDKSHPKTVSENCFPGVFRQTVPPTSLKLNMSISSIMAPIQSYPSKLFACDITCYSNAELDQYLEANRRSGFSELYNLRVLRFIQTCWSRRPRESTRRFYPEIEVMILFSCILSRE
jgi:hypothetical protein